MSTENAVETPELQFAVVTTRSEKSAEGTLEIFKQVNKQKQEILNLDSGKDEEITVFQATYIVPDFNPEIHGTLEAYESTKLKAAQSLVQPANKQADALLKYAASEVYAQSKREALASGNFMSAELRSVLITGLKARPAFSKMTAKEVFERWMKGFQSGVPQTKKYLEDAKVILSLQNGGQAEAVDEGF